MAKKNRGTKHLLLFYNRTMDRLWGITLFLGLTLFALWWFEDSFTSYYRPELKPLIYTAAIVTTVIGVFAYLARGMGYVQALDTHFVIGTPFFRFRTPYGRVRNISTTEFFRVVDRKTLSWANYNYLKPYFGNTVVVVSLRRFPVSPGILQLFFQKHLIKPKQKTIILLVPNWMSLSVELDSRYSEYRQRVRAKKKNRGFKRGMYR